MYVVFLIILLVLYLLDFAFVDNKLSVKIN